MNLLQPFEIGLNYVELSAATPGLVSGATLATYPIAPDLHTWPKRFGATGQYGGGTSASGSGTSMVANAASLWGCLAGGTIPSGTQGPPVLNAGVLTWLAGSANAGAQYYFTYVSGTRTFTLATSLTSTVVAGDAFMITTVFGQVRWRLKQLTLQFGSGTTISGWSIVDTKSNVVLVAGGPLPSTGGYPCVMGPCDSNNGLCETMNVGYGLNLLVNGTGTPIVSGSAAIEACGPLWANGDSLAA